MPRYRKDAKNRIAARSQSQIEISQNQPKVGIASENDVSVALQDDKSEGKQEEKVTSPSKVIIEEAEDKEGELLTFASRENLAAGPSTLPGSPEKKEKLELTVAEADSLQNSLNSISGVPVAATAKQSTPPGSPEKKTTKEEEKEEAKEPATTKAIAAGLEALFTRFETISAQHDSTTHARIQSSKMNGKEKIELNDAEIKPKTINELKEWSIEFNAILAARNAKLLAAQQNASQQNPLPIQPQQPAPLSLLQRVWRFFPSIVSIVLATVVGAGLYFLRRSNQLILAGMAGTMLISETARRLNNRQEHKKGSKHRHEQISKDDLIMPAPTYLHSHKRRSAKPSCSSSSSYASSSVSIRSPRRRGSVL